jgi:hypothetical protein
MAKPRAEHAARSLSLVIARLDRAIQYSRDPSDGIDEPRRTGYPACAGYDDTLLGATAAHTMRRPCLGRNCAREQGPQRERGCAHRGAAAFLCGMRGDGVQQPGSVVMGPCFRRDDDQRS